MATKLTKKSSHKRIIATWLEALRSGEYKQTKDRLHRRKGNKDSFCCLGVLCDLAVKAKVIPAPELTEDFIGNKIYSYAGSSTSLPTVVRDWAGLSDDNGVFGTDSDDSLADQNDKGKKFETIANLIESKPDRLFAEKE